MDGIRKDLLKQFNLNWLASHSKMNQFIYNFVLVYDSIRWKINNSAVI